VGASPLELCQTVKSCLINLMRFSAIYLRFMTDSNVSRNRFTSTSVAVVTADYESDVV